MTDPVLPQERPIAISVNDEELVTIMATPEKLEQLAAGFLLTSGVVRRGADIKEVSHDVADGLVWVLADVASANQRLLSQRLLTSGCAGGLLPKAAMKSLPRTTSQLSVSQETVRSAFKAMLEQAVLYHRSGGIHASALASLDEAPVFLAEDIGRHNTADKVIGWAILSGVPLDDKFLVTTGRLSSEMVIKAGRGGIPVVASRTCPTDLAVKLAQQIGITLVGQLKAGNPMIYSHAWRITGVTKEQIVDQDIKDHSGSERD